MILRAVIVWLGMMLVAILNGGLRSALLIPRLGEAAGHVLSTIVLCLAIVVLTWLTIPWIAPKTDGEAVRVGALWLAMTVAFEFGVGHYVFRQPWERLLGDYDIFRGRIWVLVPTTIALAPLIAARAQGLVR